ncbi:copper resistance D family protein [Methylocaldum sp.]|uniref:copper resistance D family protein n=1 Tax=Methylocaldum sp. TaxID=1969727 RepID=UPI002D4463DE|nr:CopD family protein [Methylocaldum sp.]HYE36809.1 CopD family protein [Methylocaldum sp.]
MYMQGLANFIDDFLGGLILISYALVVGSMLWSAFILKVWSSESVSHESVVRRGVGLLRAGAIALAVTQGLKLVIKAAVLTSVLGEFPIEAYIGTVQFQAGLVRFLLSLGLILIASQLRQTPDKQFSWNLAAILTVPMVISGAWLVHGVGRFEDREQLMTMTVLHQFAAAVWFGGVAQLLSLWHMSRRSHEAKALWPIAITRFAWLGVSSVGILLITGLPLAWTYIGSWDGLFGTGYGSLVVTKVILLIVALGFAYLNHRAGRLWLGQRQTSGIDQKVPHYIEAETFILVGVLFIAATLSSQPPSADIKELSATVSEVAEMFAPHVPRLTSPTHEQLLAGEPGRVAVVDKIPSPAATEWSDYNHNVSGLFLTSMGLIAMLSYNRRLRWARYWPLGFVGLSIFLFFRSDAETWPLGPIGFWESTFGNGEVFQHRIATLLAFALGVMEIRARTNREAYRLRYLFPMLCAFGGILLLTHAHAEFELKSEYLIQSTHTAMGLLAVIMASGRWLELRLAGTDENYGGYLEGKIAGFVSIMAMFLIGNVLLFYREPLF